MIRILFLELETEATLVSLLPGSLLRHTDAIHTLPDSLVCSPSEGRAQVALCVLLRQVAAESVVTAML